MYSLSLSTILLVVVVVCHFVVKVVVPVVVWSLVGVGEQLMIVSIYQVKESPVSKSLPSECPCKLCLSTP